MTPSWTPCGLFLLLLAAGCGPSRPARTLEQFNFVQPAITVQEVTNRLGRPDHVSGQQSLFMEYYLADGAQMLILTDSKPPTLDYAAGKVRGLAIRRGANWAWIRGSQ